MRELKIAFGHVCRKRFCGHFNCVVVNIHKMVFHFGLDFRAIVWSPASVGVGMVFSNSVDKTR